jgi:hypothetical protein
MMKNIQSPAYATTGPFSCYSSDILDREFFPIQYAYEVIDIFFSGGLKSARSKDASQPCVYLE